jgi:hypothetical protein
MAISPQDAEAALRDVGDARARSARLYRYSRGAPQLILWGVAWAVGYGLSDFYPHRADLIWTVLIPLTVVAALIVNRHDSANAKWRYIGVAAVVAAAFVLVFQVLPPTDPRQVPVVIALVTSASYLVRGLFGVPRYIVAGLALAVLSLGGFYLLPAHFLLWMGLVGGGFLIVSGLWLMRV